MSATQNDEELDILTVEKLRRMSHVQLQSVAKQMNIKANLKTAKLRDAIMDKITVYANDESSDAETSQVGASPVQDQPGVVDEAEIGNKSRRRTFDVVSPVLQSAVSPMSPPKVSASDESVFLTPKNRKPSDDDEAVFLSAKSKVMAPHMKTPKTDKKLNLDIEKIPDIGDRMTTRSRTPKIGSRVTPRSKTPKTGDTIIQRSKTPKSVDMVTSSSKTPKTGEKSNQRLKTPSAMRDQSVGQTPQPPPVRRIYNLRSNRNDAEGMKSMIPRLVKNKLVKITPRFSRIHQRAFDKMESIDMTVEKRKKLHGIRMNRPKLTANKESIFKPSVLTTKRLDLDFANMKPTTPKASSVPAAMNKTFTSAGAPQPLKPVFNLAESLAKKLRYKPYTGPLQPLSENTQPDVVPSGPIKISGHNVNTVKDKYRIENKSFLKGVRRNRRLDLQLKMRGIIE